MILKNFNLELSNLYYYTVNYKYFVLAYFEWLHFDDIICITITDGTES